MVDFMLYIGCLKFIEIFFLWVVVFIDLVDVDFSGVCDFGILIWD